MFDSRLKKAAWKELIRLTDEERNPGWYDDAQLVKKRDKLLVILGMPIEPVRKEGESKEAFHQRACQYFFDVRPGLELKVVSGILAGETFAQLSRENQIPPSKMAYLRAKYPSLSKMKKTKK